MDKIRVGVIGIGYLGKFHAKIYSEMEGVNLVGVCARTREKVEDVARLTDSTPFTDYSELFGNVDAVNIVVPTVFHHKIASDFLKQGVDVFVEKPITDNIKDAEALVKTAEEKDLILQVGHIERFNSGFMELKNLINRPRYIEAQRLSPFTHRGTDVDVTFDLMIHDIDIILSLMKTGISDIKATGISMITSGIDMANARIEFDDGCVASITAGRIFHDKTRIMRIFEDDIYLSLDYQTGEIISHKKMIQDGQPEIDITHLRSKKEDPLRNELNSFIQSVKTRSKPVVSGMEATEALKVAFKISEVINENSNG